MQGQQINNVRTHGPVGFRLNLHWMHHVGTRLIRGCVPNWARADTSHINLNNLEGETNPPA